jgi:uncharacterized protein YjbI with pentapeptide repeats
MRTTDEIIINCKSLTEILAKHELWLNDNTKGQRANLQYANLRYVNLEYADLQGANLEYADLRGANLEYADLRGANLEYDDLRGTNLRGANLRGANLQCADLQGTDLDFSCLPLWCGGLDFKIDEKQAKQLMYHVVNLMQYSKINIPESHKSLYKWLSDSHVVTEYELPILEEKGNE